MEKNIAVIWGRLRQPRNRPAGRAGAGQGGRNVRPHLPLHRRRDGRRGHRQIRRPAAPSTSWTSAWPPTACCWARWAVPSGRACPGPAPRKGPAAAARRDGPVLQQPPGQDLAPAGPRQPPQARDRGPGHRLHHRAGADRRRLLWPAPHRHPAQRGKAGGGRDALFGARDRADRPHRL